MKKNITTSEIEARFAEINALEPETPTQDDLDAIARASAESPEDTVTLEEYKAQREYSGRLLLRIPKELHKQLVEAAKENGVSLNQYALYKLAKWSKARYARLAAYRALLIHIVVIKFFTASLFV